MIDINITKKEFQKAKDLEFQFTDYLGQKQKVSMNNYLKELKEMEIEDLKKRLGALMVEYSERYWVTLYLDNKKVAWLQCSQF